MVPGTATLTANLMVNGGPHAGPGKPSSPVFCFHAFQLLTMTSRKPCAALYTSEDPFISLQVVLQVCFVPFAGVARCAASPVGRAR